MEIYRYLVDLMKRVKGSCELVFNQEVRFKKTDDDIVCLSVASFYTESMTPINSIESIGGGFVVNGDIKVNLKETYLEFRIKYMSLEVFKLMIQDSRDLIKFQLSYGVGAKFRFGDNKIKFGYIEIELTGQEIKLIPTEEYLELVVGNSKLSIPKRTSSILFEIKEIDRVPTEY